MKTFEYNILSFPMTRKTSLADMQTFNEATASSQQQAVFRKYSNPKFGAVAKMPLTF